MAEKKGMFARLFEGLSKTRNSLTGQLSDLFTADELDDEFYEGLEEILITSDIGVRTTNKILEDLQERVEEQGIKKASECQSMLVDSIRRQMYLGENAYNYEEEKAVLLVIGVNGVGKTTSIGKLAGQLKGMGKSVMLAAADTFRAGAIEQLSVWAERAGVPIIAHKEGADPGAVVYDAVTSAKAKDIDVLICDTAGRLQNKKNLMDELGKINRIIDKDYPEAFRETLLVLDGTTGQNALSQAREFMEVCAITGIILTKMDGTAKGGIAVAIQSELGIPVKYIGVGESIEDLQKFDAAKYVSALFDVNTKGFLEEDDRQIKQAEALAQAAKAAEEEEARRREEEQKRYEEQLAEEAERKKAAEEAARKAAKAAQQEKKEEEQQAPIPVPGGQVASLDEKRGEGELVVPEEETELLPPGALTPKEFFSKGIFLNPGIRKMLVEAEIPDEEFDIETFDFEKYAFKEVRTEA